MAIDPKININENQVIFRRDSVGHKHDGLTSALIDTTKYSMLDFAFYPNASPGTPRRSLQENNLIAFKTQVVAAIEERVLNPRGIRVQANSITANEIAANSITATELAANVVLVNNIIKSNNYASGSAGWAINGNGNAEFSNVTVRGTVVANNGSIAGINISSSSIYSSDYDGTNGFAIYSNGFADFNEVSVRGEIIATSGSISDNFSIGNNVTVGSNVNIGNNAVILNNLTIGNNIRINGAAGDGSKSVLKVRADNQPNTNTSNPGRQPLTVSSFLDNTAFRVLYDGRCYYGTSMELDSDFRLKKNIETISLGLDFVNQLNPVKFNWDKQDVLIDKKYYGFIAQEIVETSNKFDEPFEPWSLQNEEDPDSYLSLDYIQFIPPITKAIQELSEKVDSLEARLQAIEGV